VSYLCRSFSFSQLDPKNPNRKFSFDLEADETYNISECEPPLDTFFLDELLRELNVDETNDMIPLVQGMRRAFLEWISTNESP
jgi:hypothetical protein